MCSRTKANQCKGIKAAEERENSEQKGIHRYEHAEKSNRRQKPEQSWRKAAEDDRGDQTKNEEENKSGK